MGPLLEQAKIVSVWKMPIQVNQILQWKFIDSSNISEKLFWRSWGLTPTSNQASHSHLPPSPLAGLGGNCKGNCEKIHRLKYSFISKARGAQASKAKQGIIHCFPWTGSCSAIPRRADPHQHQSMFLPFLLLPRTF